ncbi:histidine kinase [Emticicia sp. BO119]|uniref:histidine kinase n=1 Tax=Emticicia sp. BO119 TaxID=2757768 RepID=UPI0015F0E6AF|nr:histidine kinase [Emticicia sp. BO119]MBA4848763.1 histidine kinase [Emticicia sp. BO119]
MIFFYPTLLLVLMNVFLYVAMGLLLLVSFLWSLTNYLKQKRESHIVAKIRELENVMGNPQFLYSNLNSIKQYVLLHSPMEAAQYLTEFSNLLRSISTNSKQKNISLAQEIETVILFLELEKKRLGERMEFFQEIETNLNTETIQVKPLFVFKQIEELIQRQSDYASMKIHLLVKNVGEKLNCRTEGAMPNTTFIIEIPTK